MWELDHREGWALKNWYFQIIVLEKALKSLFDSKEIKPMNSKGNQPWLFTGRIDDEAEAPIFWPPDAKSQLTGKDPDAEKDWEQEKKVATEDEMVGWHYWLNRREFEQIPGDTEGQGSLACFSHWGCKEVRHDLGTEQQNYLNCCLKIFPCFCCHKNLGFLCPPKLNKKCGGSLEEIERWL